jgi:hypothetical protein
MRQWLKDLERIDPYRKERYKELGMSPLTPPNHICANCLLISRGLDSGIRLTGEQMERGAL